MTGVSLAARLVLRQVGDERAAQDARWGQQNHPDAPPHSLGFDRRDAVTKADWWKKENDYRVRAGKIAWDGILLEEVFEALAETDNTERLREELVQVAAVACAWVEAIDRRPLLDAMLAREAA